MRKLSVNASVTEVQVVAEGGVEVNTQTQELSQVIDTHQMEQLPSLTRNPYDFVGLSGNVSSGDSTGSGTMGGQNLTSRGVGYAINGQRESGTEILLDGVENIAVFNQGIGEDIPVDAVQEYSVITNNYSAEFGRASGGVVNVTTKAGTNKFHGSGWEFNRLSAYTANTYANDAANWAAMQQDLPTSPGHIHPKPVRILGCRSGMEKQDVLRGDHRVDEGTQRGRVENEEVVDPAFIAMLPANAKAYFGTYGTGALPSAGVAATWGNLETTSFGNPLLNGVTQIPASTPLFDTVNFHAPFDAGGGVPENTYQLIGRADYNPTDKTQMFFRVGREDLTQPLGTASYSAYPQYDVGSATLNQSYLYSLSHTFSNDLFGSLKASFTRFNTANSYETSLTYSPNLMFVAPTNPFSGGLIQMPGLENASNPGTGGLPFGGPQNTIQAEPDISWTKGKHTMRFGGLYTYIQMNVAYGAYAQAVEELGATGAASMANLVNGDGNTIGSQLVEFDARVNPQNEFPCVANPSFWTTNDPADLIASAACTITPPLSSANPARSYRYKDWALYGQDSYKFTPKLTFNYGLR